MHSGSGQLPFFKQRQPETFQTAIGAGVTYSGDGVDGHFDRFAIPKRRLSFLSGGIDPKLVEQLNSRGGGREVGGGPRKA